MVSVSLLEDGEKSESSFFSLNNILDGSLVAGDLIYLSELGTSMIPFQSILIFRNIGWFEAMYIFFYAENIFDLYNITSFWR